LRTFLSYDIEEATVLSNVRKLQRELQGTGADLKLVEPDILHFTIRFLGEINEQQKEEIVQSLEGKVPPLELAVHFRGLGTFPNEKRISVVWIACDETSSRELGEQARLVNKLLDQVQTLPKEDANKNFQSHVTIARVKSGRNKAELQSFIAEHKDEDFGSARLGRLKLKLSELFPEGPRYTDVHEFS